MNPDKQDPTTLPGTSGVSQVAMAPRIPPFWQEQPCLWFAQFEAVISSSKLSHSQKTQLLIAQLDANTLQLTGDIILDENCPDKYEKIKERLIQTCGTPAAGRLQQVLNADSSSEPPTVCLARLRTSALGLLTPEALRLLWLEKLPPDIRAVACATDAASINQAAERANEAWFLAQNTRTSVNELTELRQQVATLQSWHDSTPRFNSRILPRQNKQSRRTSSPRRHSPRGHSPSRQTWCYYHTKFGSTARRCQPPCTWKKNE